MKFDKNGRAISDHLILWIPKFLYLAVAFLSVIFLLKLLIITNVDTSEAEAKLLTNRIYYSPNLISLLDLEIGRAYPGIIDLEKYRQLQNSDINKLDAETITYGQENRLIAAKLSLINMDINTEEIVFYNKENYEFWEPRLLSTVTGGSGSAKSFVEQRYVLIKTGDTFQKGKLKMQVIVRQ